MSNSSVIALAAVTLATFFNSLAFVMMKLALIKSEQNEGRFFLRWQYMCGITLLILAAIVQVVSLAFSDIITLTSTSSMTMVFNIILSIKILNEKFNRYDFISIVLIMCGASLCVFFSNYDSKDLSTSDVMNLFFSPQCISFVLIVLSVVISSQLCSTHIIKKISTVKISPQELESYIQEVSTDRSQSFQNDPNATNDQSINAEDQNQSTRILIQVLMKMDDAQLQKINQSFKLYFIRIPLLLYPFSSGILSSLTTSLVKGFSEIMKNNSLQDNLMTFTPYLMLVMIVSLLLSQVHCMNNGLRYYNQLEIIPIYQSSVIISNIMSGGIIFQEFWFYTATELMLVAVGTLVCVVGILIIVKKYELENMHSNKFEKQVKPSEIQLKDFEKMSEFPIVEA